MVVALKDWKSVLGNCYVSFNDKKYNEVRWSILNDRIIQFSNSDNADNDAVVFAGVKYIDINCATLLIVMQNGDKYLTYRYSKCT